MIPINKKISTKSAKETQKLGKNLAKKLQGGEIIGLSGNLGAGKTVFCKGVAQGLGIKQNITSPTFVLWRVYKVSKDRNIKYFCHLDLYRLQKPKEILALGIEEYWQRDDTVFLIEWVEKIKQYLPNKQSCIVKFEIGNQKTRKITIGGKLLYDF